MPQRVFKGQERMLGAFEEIAEVGRNFGIGLFLISQRPQKINKDVLNFADNLLGLSHHRQARAGCARGVGSGEGRRRTARHWRRLARAADRDLLRMEPHPRGVRHVQDHPQGHLRRRRDAACGCFQGVYQASRSSSSRKGHGEGGRGRAGRARRRRWPPSAGGSASRWQSWNARGPNLNGKNPSQNLGELGKMVHQASVDTYEIREVVVKKLDALRDRILACDKLLETLVAGKTSRLSRGLAFERVTQLKKEFPRPKPIDVSKQTAKIMQTLATGEHRVLVAAAQHASQGGVTREQLTVLCGYKRSSRDTFIQRLRAAELLKVEGDKVAPTERGMEYLGSDFEALPSGKALLEYWRQRLSEGERRVLDAAVSVYPDGVSRDQLDAETGYKRSSRDTFIQRLRSRQLCTTTGGEVRASDMLFDFPERM